ncbi:MAG: diaminopimelate epimerase, partial [Flavobacteriales bacterium]|nr:diaminopimelate epimerase [Flavobacteriales bacterium]
EVSLKMHDVKEIEVDSDYYYINTGSPHFIIEKADIKKVDVKTEGAAIRYNERFKAEGTNVNFVNYKEQELDIRTYERGVEDETLSCGTGVTAAALSWADKNNVETGKIKVNTVGGALQVAFKMADKGFKDIWLIGPAEQVFKGEVEL